MVVLQDVSHVSVYREGGILSYSAPSFIRNDRTPPVLLQVFPFNTPLVAILLRAPWCSGKENVHWQCHGVWSSYDFVGVFIMFFSFVRCSSCSIWNVYGLSGEVFSIWNDWHYCIAELQISSCIAGKPTWCDFLPALTWRLECKQYFVRTWICTNPQQIWTINQVSCFSGGLCPSWRASSSALCASSCTAACAGCLWGQKQWDWPALSTWIIIRVRLAIDRCQLDNLPLISRWGTVQTISVTANLIRHGWPFCPCLFLQIKKHNSFRCAMCVWEIKIAKQWEPELPGGIPNRPMIKGNSPIAEPIISFLLILPYILYISSRPLQSFCSFSLGHLITIILSCFGTENNCSLRL